MISGIDYIMQLEQEIEKQRRYAKKEKEKKKELQIKIDKAKEYIKKFDFNYLDETYEHNLREHLENILEILGGKE